MEALQVRMQCQRSGLGSGGDAQQGHSTPLYGGLSMGEWLQESGGARSWRHRDDAPTTNFMDLACRAILPHPTGTYLCQTEESKRNRWCTQWI